MAKKMTRDTIEYMYLRELHDCAKVNAYMGLWQLAIAANVLQVPVQSVYPMDADPLMRLDFNRIFYPLSITSSIEVEKDPITIMWTSTQLGCTPMHFVPLLPKRFKYDGNCVKVVILHLLLFISGYIIK